MRRLWIMISGVMLFAASASAKVWLLPDYQQQQIFSHRVNGGVETPPVQPETTVDCRRYGMIPASEVSDGMSCSSSTQILETVCYGGCSCSAAYSQTSSSCRSEGKIPAGSSCMGEYFTACICDTSLYPHTSSSCAYTPGGASCSDDDGKHFAKCKNPCDGLTDNETDLGCEKYYDQCPSLCEVGKTCAPSDCSGYSLSECPEGYACNSCDKGWGDDKVFYKISGCGLFTEVFSEAELIAAAEKSCNTISVAADITLHQDLNIENDSRIYLQQGISLEGSPSARLKFYRGTNCVSGSRFYALQMSANSKLRNLDIYFNDRCASSGYGLWAAGNYNRINKITLDNVKVKAVFSNFSSNTVGLSYIEPEVNNVVFDGFDSYFSGTIINSGNWIFLNDAPSLSPAVINDGNFVGKNLKLSSATVNGGRFISSSFIRLFPPHPV